MTRQEANRKIVNFLSAAVEQHPEWRFQQILQIIDVNIRDVATLNYYDLFYEESEETLERVEHAVNELNTMYSMRSALK